MCKPSPWHELRDWGEYFLFFLEKEMEAQKEQELGLHRWHSQEPSQAYQALPSLNAICTILCTQQVLHKSSYKAVP